MRLKVLALCMLVPVLSKADVWPSFGRDTLGTAMSPFNGPECCNIVCKVDIEWSMASPVMDDNGHLYIQGREPDTFDDWYLWCVNTSDCTVNWRYMFALGTPMLPLHSSCGLSHVDGTIYVGYVNGLYAINPDGSLKWSYVSGDLMRSSPTVATDGTIYVGCDDEYLYAINPDGTMKWRYATGGVVYSSPAIGSDGTIYVGDDWDDLLHAMNPSGTVKWTFETGSSIVSSPAIGSDGTIYIGSNDDYLYAVNPDGTQKWRYNTGGNVVSSPAIDNDKGVIYVGSESEGIFAIDTSGALVWATPLGKGTGYSSPALSDSNNMLYVGDRGGELYVIDANSGIIICFNSHSWRITSPAIDDPASNGGNWCVWYNEFCEAIYKVCCPPIGVEEGCSSVTKRLSLSISPNPCVTSPTISFGLPSQTQVSIEVYDIGGRLIRNLARGNRSAGEHTLEWNAENLPRGVYFCKLTTPTRALARKLIVTR